MCQPQFLLFAYGTGLVLQNLGLLPSFSASFALVDLSVPIERNPNIVKYLLNKTSVDNIECVCRSCSTYFCAIVNGMQFPPKPALFDLNELECRLIAPRLAFQKLMQAPRERGGGAT